MESLTYTITQTSNHIKTTLFEHSKLNAKHKQTTDSWDKINTFTLKIENLRYFHSQMLLGNNICRKHTLILDIYYFRWKYLQNLFHDCIREDSLLKVHPGYMRRILLLVLYRPYSGRRFSHYLRFSHLHVFHIIDVFHFCLQTFIDLLFSRFSSYTVEENTSSSSLFT